MAIVSWSLSILLKSKNIFKNPKTLLRIVRFRQIQVENIQIKYFGGHPGTKNNF